MYTNIRTQHLQCEFVQSTEELRFLYLIKDGFLDDLSSVEGLAKAVGLPESLMADAKAIKNSLLSKDANIGREWIETRALQRERQKIGEIVASLRYSTLDKSGIIEFLKQLRQKAKLVQ
eukprot:c17239_g1_i2.p4 GENE.c17239_g1_i2~~c17239_g1_i2.p4  ORF type:complete len:119 (-),score=35.13 c17239_g1_i2:750-1106(-)